MAIVDTSFLIALQDERDHFHKEAMECPLWGEPLLVPWEIWVEYCQMMLRLAPPRVALLRMQNILDGPFSVRPVSSAEDFLAFAARFDALQDSVRRLGRPPLTVFDLVVCAVAARMRDSVLTFDEGMRQSIRQKLFPGARLAN